MTLVFKSIWTSEKSASLNSANIKRVPRRSAFLKLVFTMVDLDKFVADCRKAHGDAYIRLVAFDSTRGFETVTMSFIVNRPKEEPHLKMTRTEVDGRSIRYTHEVVR